MGPGFTVDEPWESLGESLQLPSWLERSRERLEGALQPIAVEAWDVRGSPRAPASVAEEMNPVEAETSVAAAAPESL